MIFKLTFLIVDLAVFGVVVSLDLEAKEKQKIYKKDFMINFPDRAQSWIVPRLLSSVLNFRDPTRNLARTSCPDLASFLKY